MILNLKTSSDNKSSLTLFLNSKIDNCCFSGNFWSIMRIAQFCRYVETKTGIIFNFTITKSYNWYATW